MRIATRKRLGILLLAALAIPANAASDALENARALAATNKWAEVVAALEEHLRFAVAEPEVDDLMGQALTKLGRKDEAAFFLDRALSQLPASDKEYAKVRKRLLEADPLTTRRETALAKITKTLLESAKALHAGGHVERALAILERLQPIARGAELSEIAALSSSIRSATEKVDLDKVGDGERPAEGWPEYKFESQRYLFRADLEPTVTETLAKTMDEIFEYYVQIYFDGERSRLDPRKATIFVHSSHADMGKSFPGDGPTPGGWWSPGDWQVHCYDTRGDAGTLDEMLATLFHEASHQFMTMLAGGGGTPAWLNEGTSSFFEGAIAMADGRVLWPDAAQSRLLSLNDMLNGKSYGGPSPTFLEVISYNKPGSYDPPYYPWGWGLVYFLQQYEDPQTLEYTYRPKYIAYRDQVIKTGGEPRALFERVFVGAGKHSTVAAFETEWKRWIQQTIYPLHFGVQRRELRMAEVQRYLDAAKAAAAAPKQAKVKEGELLLRALGHIEYVRSKIDGPDKPDAQLLLAQADILERVGRAQSTAPLLEQLLEMAMDGRWTADEDEVDKLGKRLSKLDSKNSALRLAQARAKSLGRMAGEILSAYDKSKPPAPLRSYTLASAVSAALGEAGGLVERASELRQRAYDAGLLRGATYRLDPRRELWRTIHTNVETKFDTAPGRVELEGVRPVGRLCTATPISGEYELRARVTRVGEAPIGAHHGLVVSGTLNGDWLVVTLDGNGKLWLKRLLLLNRGEGVGVSDTNVSYIALANPPALDQAFDFLARVSPSGVIEVTVDGDGPHLFQAPLAIPAVGYVGVYVKNGSLLVENAVVEVLP
jgi:tetratricopeptide (TPR) repeat protein